MDLHAFLVVVMVMAAVLVFVSLHRKWHGPYLFAVTVLVACSFALGPAGCASVRPQIQAARDDLVLACRQLASALAADTEPSKAERIMSDVCAVERLAEPIEHAVAKATGATDLFTDDPPPFLDSPPAQP